MIKAFVFVEAEPTRVQELVAELHDLKLARSVIKEVYGVSGRWDIIAVVESPDLPALGD